MERDQIAIVECVLWLYPRIAQALRQREEYLRGISSPVSRERVDGGERLAEQDFILSRLAEDTDCQLMSGIVEPVSAGLERLSELEQKIVDAVYFRGCTNYVVGRELAYSESYIHNVRQRALEKLKGICMGVYSAADAWREKDRKERLESVRGAR